MDDAEKKKPTHLEELLSWWRAGAQTGRFDSAKTNETMIAILTELTKRQKDN